MPVERFKPGELLEAAAIARRYYLEGRAKLEIAQEFGMSRFRVARILERARASGLVRINIVLPAQIDAELSERLRSAFALRHAVVVAAPPEPEGPLREQLGAAAAVLLSELVKAGDVLGVTWGRTLDAMAESAAALAPCTVVQMTGAAGVHDVAEESAEIVQRLAAVSGGSACPIYAPLVLDTAETAAAMRRQPHVAEALGRFDQLTVAVMAVGTWDPPNSRLRSSLSVAEREALQRQGVAAEVCASLVDGEGRVLAGDYLARTIAVRPEQLRRIPEVIAVAGGPTKVAALRALLRAGFVTSVVTDAAAARALLALRAAEAPAGVRVSPLLSREP